jgi:hypothetical protein
LDNWLRSRGRCGQEIRAETMSDDLEVNNLVDVDTLQYETLKLLNEIKEIKKKKSSHSPFKG